MATRGRKGITMAVAGTSRKSTDSYLTRRRKLEENASRKVLALEKEHRDATLQINDDIIRTMNTRTNSIIENGKHLLELRLALWSLEIELRFKIKLVRDTLEEELELVNCKEERDKERYLGKTRTNSPSHVGKVVDGNTTSSRIDQKDKDRRKDDHWHTNLSLLDKSYEQSEVELLVATIEVLGRRENVKAKIIREVQVEFRYSLQEASKLGNRRHQSVDEETPKKLDEAVEKTENSCGTCKPKVDGVGSSNLDKKTGSELWSFEKRAVTLEKTSLGDGAVAQGANKDQLLGRKAESSVVSQSTLIALDVREDKSYPAQKKDLTAVLDLKTGEYLESFIEKAVTQEDVSFTDRAVIECANNDQLLGRKAVSSDASHNKLVGLDVKEDTYPAHKEALNPVLDQTDENCDDGCSLRSDTAASQVEPHQPIEPLAVTSELEGQSVKTDGVRNRRFLVGDKTVEEHSHSDVAILVSSEKDGCPGVCSPESTMKSNQIVAPVKIEWSSDVRLKKPIALEEGTNTSYQDQKKPLTISNSDKYQAASPPASSTEETLVSVKPPKDGTARKQKTRWKKRPKKTIERLSRAGFMERAEDLSQGIQHGEESKGKADLDSFQQAENFKVAETKRIRSLGISDKDLIVFGGRKDKSYAAHKKPSFHCPRKERELGHLEKTLEPNIKHVRVNCDCENMKNLGQNSGVTFPIDQDRVAVCVAKSSGENLVDADKRDKDDRSRINLDASSWPNKSHRPSDFNLSATATADQGSKRNRKSKKWNVIKGIQDGHAYHLLEASEIGNHQIENRSVPECREEVIVVADISKESCTLKNDDDNQGMRTESFMPSAKTLKVIPLDDDGAIMGADKDHSLAKSSWTNGEPFLKKDRAVTIERAESLEVSKKALIVLGEKWNTSYKPHEKLLIPRVETKSQVVMPSVSSIRRSLDIDNLRPFDIWMELEVFIGAETLDVLSHDDVAIEESADKDHFLEDSNLDSEPLSLKSHWIVAQGEKIEVSEVSQLVLVALDGRKDTSYAAHQESFKQKSKRMRKYQAGISPPSDMGGSLDHSRLKPPEVINIRTTTRWKNKSREVKEVSFLHAAKDFEMDSISDEAVDVKADSDYFPAKSSLSSAVSLLKTKQTDALDGKVASVGVSKNQLIAFGERNYKSYRAQKKHLTLGDDNKCQAVPSAYTGGSLNTTRPEPSDGVFRRSENTRWRKNLGVIWAEPSGFTVAAVDLIEDILEDDIAEREADFNCSPVPSNLSSETSTLKWVRAVAAKERAVPLEVSMDYIISFGRIKDKSYRAKNKPQALRPCDNRQAAPAFHTEESLTKRAQRRSQDQIGPSHWSDLPLFREWPWHRGNQRTLAKWILKIDRGRRKHWTAKVSHWSCWEGECRGRYMRNKGRGGSFG